MRIKSAFNLGYQSGRYWARQQTSIIFDDLTLLNPYSNYWPAVQCFVAWKIGFWLAFYNQDKAKKRDWTMERSLYGI